MGGRKVFCSAVLDEDLSEEEDTETERQHLVTQQPFADSEHRPSSHRMVTSPQASPQAVLIPALQADPRRLTAWVGQSPLPQLPMVCSFGGKILVISLFAGIESLTNSAAVV